MTYAQLSPRTPSPSSKLAALATPPRTKIVAVSKEEADAMQESDSEEYGTDGTYDEPQPDELDDPWPYTFRTGESVWVRTSGGNWLEGRVIGGKTKKGATRVKEGLFYSVVFNNKIRKYFAPLNGEIKPDTQHVRRLLKNEGWL